VFSLNGDTVHGGNGMFETDAQGSAQQSGMTVGGKP